MTTRDGNYFTSPECQMLSTTMYRHCSRPKRCDNPMHETNDPPVRRVKEDSEDSNNLL